VIASLAPLGFLTSSVAAQWCHRFVDHDPADKDLSFSHSGVLENWKESGMSEDLSAKAKAAGFMSPHEVRQAATMKEAA
jgi:hypothetical protein